MIGNLPEWFTQREQDEYLGVPGRFKCEICHKWVPNECESKREPGCCSDCVWDDVDDDETNRDI